jgi:invasion protein IalB
METCLFGGVTMTGLRIGFAGLAAIVMMWSGAALAQTETPSEPNRTTATYEDWLVQCRQYVAPAAPAAVAVDGSAAPAVDGAAAEPAKTGKICEMVQTYSFRQTGQQLAKLAIGKLPDQPTIKAVVQTPLSVYLPDGVALKIGETDYKAAFVRCTTGFCLAEADLPADIAALVQAAKTATLTFTNVARQPVALNVSLKGAAGAFPAALAEQAR